MRFMTGHLSPNGRLFIATLLLLAATFPAAAEEVLQIRAASGAKLRSLLTGETASARANVILLVGGKGVLRISGKGQIKSRTTNFLVRTRHLFAKAGYLTALVDAPLDRRKNPGLLGGFRASKEHARDLSKVARKLHALNNRPIIIIGTSRGTVSAANLALRDTSTTIRALVLTSALVRPNAKGSIITDLPLHKLKMPVLFLHNKGDRCKVTLLRDLRPIVRNLKKRNSKADLIIVNSSRKTGKHCRGMSPHGFLGIESQVVEQIAGWIDR